MPLDWHWDAPAYWEGPRGDGDKLTSDLCVWTDDAGDVAYFVCGLLTLPIVDSEGEFVFGVWSSLSQASFQRVVDLWDDPARVEEPTYFGWLSNGLPGYPPTLNLPANVVTDRLDYRPQIVLHAGEHPLIHEQRDGITSARVQELVELMLHPV